MIILTLFAFIAGVVTILSPCILPILPIVLSGSVTGGKRKPLGIVTGFVGSFTFFTLFLSLIVRAFHVPADALRVLSIVIIFAFGFSLIIPKFQALLEQFFSKISGKLSPKSNQDGFFPGIVVGLSLGLLWTPCVGPILASVITLALSGTVTAAAFIITFAYSLGTAIPMLIIAYTGRSLFTKLPWLLKRTANIQQVFGVIMVLTALALMFNIDRKFQVWILQTFPQYGTGLTSFENNAQVKKQLDQLQPNTTNTSDTTAKTGQPSFTMLEDLGKAPEIIPGGQWFNLPDGKTSLSMKELRGKVVLVDFWTYSCINCIRTLPYLRDWDQKYADKGLVIIGVHSPEFEFEKDAGNLKKAIADFKIKYPVVQDNNFDTWKVYGGNTWPRKYLIDKNGTIRNFHSGEGQYAETEKLIQQLLSETGEDVSNMPVNDQEYTIDTRSPETYLGYERIEGLASPEPIEEDVRKPYTSPEHLEVNDFAFDGVWNIHSQYAEPFQAPISRLLYHFDAKNVYLVMRPKEKGKVGHVMVNFNGHVVNDDEIGIHEGTLTIDSDRLYTLLKLDKRTQGTIELIFLDENVEVFAFTFG